MGVTFGAVIPVGGLNIGFIGQVSRTNAGEPIIAARQVLSTAAHAISFGAPVVLLADFTGGTWESVADFIAGGGTFTAALFAGVAVREVQTDLVYPTAPGSSSGFVGSYSPGALCDVLERGSITVNCANGTPQAGKPVFVRTVLNGAIPAGIVGDFEAVADGGNTVQLTNVVFRTGVQDANGTVEITLLERVAA